MELLRNLDLEAAIIEAPEDLAPRMVYGDWLAAQGDPRGPWFALSAAVEAAPLDVRLRSAATEMFHAHGALFLGDGVALRPNAWFGWRGGFLDEIRIHPFAQLRHATRAAKALVHHPHARFTRHVALGNFGRAMPDLLTLLAVADLPLLEAVTLVDARVATGDPPVDLDRLIDSVPLTRLGAHAVRWSQPMPQLRELHLELLDPSLALLETTPNLEQLTLDCRECTPEPVAIARAIHELPRLHTLRVLHCEDVQALVGALTPPPAPLRRIDLSHSALADVSLVMRWPVELELVAIRTRISLDDEARMKAAGRRVSITRPALHAWHDLRTDTGEDTWLVHRAKAGDRAGLALVPDGGRQLLESAMRQAEARTYDPAVMEVCVTLPSAVWHAWPWAVAASARSWHREYALSEAIAREGLMREPTEPNFYAFVTYSLRRQGLLTEAVAEVPRAEAALAQPPPDAHYSGPQLCLIDCMFTLAQSGDYAAALALANRLTSIDDPNIQAVRAICHAATGNGLMARVAYRKAGEATLAYVNEPARRAVYDHATAVIALLPPLDPDAVTAMFKIRDQMPELSKYLVDEIRDAETAAAKPPVEAGAWQPAESAIEAALTALERAWPVYPERGWFKTDRTLAAVHQHPRFLALTK